MTDKSNDIENKEDIVDSSDIPQDIEPLSLEKGTEQEDYSKNNEGITEDMAVPMDVHIGFYSNITKKQVKKHVLSYAEKNFTSLNDVNYQIVPYEDGFLFELHQSGSGLGYISDYLNNHYADALIVTSSNIYRASPSTHGGIRLVKLTDDDVREVSSNPDNFDILEGLDKLRPLKSTGFGFFVFATIFFTLSVLSIGISASLKYILLDKTDAIYFTNMNKTYPHEFIPDIQNETYQMDLSSEYFANFYFDDSISGEKKWSIEKKSILDVNEDGQVSTEFEDAQ